MAADKQNLKRRGRGRGFIETDLPISPTCTNRQPNSIHTQTRCGAAADRRQQPPTRLKTARFIELSIYIYILTTFSSSLTIESDWYFVCVDLSGSWPTNFTAPTISYKYKSMIIDIFYDDCIAAVGHQSIDHQSFCVQPCISIFTNQFNCVCTDNFIRVSIVAQNRLLSMSMFYGVINQSITKHSGWNMHFDLFQEKIWDNIDVTCSKGFPRMHL